MVHSTLCWRVASQGGSGVSETNLEQFREVTPEGRFTLQNSAMLKVRLENDQIQAKLGSMVAYQGDVRFEHQSGGLGRFFKKAVEGAGRLAGGLFNVVLEGTGRVALTSDGEPVLLDTSTPTFADPESAIAWSGGVRTGVRSDVSFKNLTGRGSGGAVQISFEGPGWVLIQPSEGAVVPEHSHAGEGGGGGGIGSLFED